MPDTTNHGRFFAGAGVGDVARVVVTTKTSVPRLAEIFAITQLETLKAWQAFSTIDAADPYRPDAYVQGRFSFANLGRSACTRAPLDTGSRLC